MKHRSRAIARFVGLLAGWAVVAAVQARGAEPAPAQAGEPVQVSGAPQAPAQAPAPRQEQMLVPVPVQGQGGRIALQHEVFQRPSLAPAAALPTVPAGVPGVAPAASEAAAWNPALRAVLVAGARSMVLVDRSVLEVGERLDGYRLEGVGEDRAVFVKGRQRVVLWLGKTRTVE